VIGLREIYREPEDEAKPNNGQSADRVFFAVESAQPAVDYEVIEAWLMTAVQRAVAAVVGVEVALGTGISERLQMVAAALSDATVARVWELHPDDAALVGDVPGVTANAEVERGTVRALTGADSFEDSVAARMHACFASAGWH
jgi:hypothetical protein